MIIVGLTGSIGMGKSTTANMFRDEGIPVYDADATVHALYEGEAVGVIEKVFPGTIIDGKVDRTLLGAEVFGKPQAMKRLEELVHPLVHAKEQEFLKQSEAADQSLVVLDIPLLFETSGQNRVDIVIVVSAGFEEQRRRVLAREGMTVEKFESIIAKQIPDSEKLKHADYIIDTSNGLEEARQQVHDVIKKITKNL